MDHLGSGQFGTVDRGVWRSPEGDVPVAVKTLNPGVKEEDRVKFLQEAAIMGQFSHSNVVKLYGVVTVGEPVSCVELCNCDIIRNSRQCCLGEGIVYEIMILIDHDHHQ